MVPLLLNVAALVKKKMPEPVRTAVPAFVRVRVSRVLLSGPVIARVAPDATVVVPVPSMVPPVQLRVLVTVKGALPPRTPLLWVNKAVPAGWLKFSVPLERLID